MANFYESDICVRTVAVVGEGSGIPCTNGHTTRGRCLHAADGLGGGAHHGKGHQPEVESGSWATLLSTNPINSPVELSAASCDPRWIGGAVASNLRTRVMTYDPWVVWKSVRKRAVDFTCSHVCLRVEPTGRWMKLLLLTMHN
ncbi:Aste57867_23360 [Aphanomyces stellatus]|uniref:Aste57867_23360 protein n=1 Tax=Aphanomyces stellatus TaxID=120398 RepID=A0A485LMF9_9STRA|nr:hypothetical protein As57867_023289 [Aphanomyces stellatus]VFU00006.1 Aste57867_23360 [Aphanomyces stellatus]